MLWRRLFLSGSILPASRPSTRLAAGAYSSYGLIPTANDQLLKNRMVLLIGPISDTKSSVVIDKLLFLEFQDTRKPIHLHIGSPGGSVSAVLAIYNTIQYIRSRVSTFCIGNTESMASLLLAAGAPGERRISSLSSVMIHQPYRDISSSLFSLMIRQHISGPAVHLNIGAKHIRKLRERLIKIYSHHTGQSIERIEQCMEHDTYMSPYEAKEFGLVDEVIVPRGLALLTDQGSSNEGTKSGNDDGHASKEHKLWF
ncbi:ATP-dependent Clp protease proteolytic subunit-like [Zingiber officinale]|uniref:ATP-dependent Clp protease proteolytic subunit-like n=1 Tax=Zingiber officinale TaxID=94328 RepID=UPI001C4A9AE0|nr:ATP-dependent Clp protease proteolytic subunit-like [Zingiber officinale]